MNNMVNFFVALVMHIEGDDIGTTNLTKVSDPPILISTSADTSSTSFVASSSATSASPVSASEYVVGTVSPPAVLANVYDSSVNFRLVNNLFKWYKCFFFVTYF